jgi:hypothetical protein
MWSRSSLDVTFSTAAYLQRILFQARVGHVLGAAGVRPPVLPPAGSRAPGEARTAGAAAGARTRT